MYARITRYAVRAEQIPNAQNRFRESIGFVRKVRGLELFTNFMADDGSGLLVAVYENKAAAGAAAPLVHEFWGRFADLLRAPPALEEFSTVLAVEILGDVQNNPMH